MSNDDEQKRLWFVARDTLFSQNEKRQNFQEALRLAKLSTHVEAQWLVNFCEKNGGMPNFTRQVVAMFMTHRDDPKAVFYGAFIRDQHGILQEHVETAADNGDSFAQVLMFFRYAYHLVGNVFDERFVNYLKRSIEQEDHFGLYLYGIYLTCCKSPPNAIEGTFRYFLNGGGSYAHVCNHLKRAIDLGNVDAIRFHERSFSLDQPERYYWSIEYAVVTKRARHCFPFKKQIDDYQTKGGVLESRIMFQIGKSLNGRVSNLLGRMSVNGAEVRSFRSEAHLACSIFKSWCSLTREAVDAWTIIAIRFRICKDMRRLIANMIWMTRSDGEYLLNKNGKFNKRNKKRRSVL